MAVGKQSIFKIVKYAAAPSIGLLILSWAIWVLISKIKGISAGDVITQIRLVHPIQIAAAVGLALLNYSVLTGYDFFGLRYSGIKLPFRKIALTTIVGDALNSNLGLNIIIGSSVKLRFYSSWGIRVPKIIKAIGVYTIGGYWNGFLFLTGLALIWASPKVLPTFMPPVFWRCTGILFLLVVVFWLFNALFNKKTLKVGRFTLEMPGPSTAFPLFLVACCDWAIAASIFYVLLPHEWGIAWHQLLAVYLVAHFVGMVSQAPGGIAVFESVVFSLTPNMTSRPSLLASLVLFRVIFYFIPLAFATVLFLLFEIHTTKRIFKKRAK